MAGPVDLSLFPSLQHRTTTRTNQPTNKNVKRHKTSETERGRDRRTLQLLFLFLLLHSPMTNGIGSDEADVILFLFSSFFFLPQRNVNDVVVVCPPPFPSSALTLSLTTTHIDKKVNSTVHTHTHNPTL